MTRIILATARVFQRKERGSLIYSRLRAFSPLVSSRGDISSSTRPPITRHHAVLASASPFSARKKERSRRSARRRMASVRRFIRWLRVTSPAAAPASASLPCPRPRRRQAPSSCPPRGVRGLRPSAERRLGVFVRARHLRGVLRRRRGCASGALGSGSTTSCSPSVESVTPGLRLLPSPGASAVSKASCEARATTARPRRERRSAARRADRCAEAPRPESVEADAACAETWSRSTDCVVESAASATSRGVRATASGALRRRTMRLVRCSRARWCAGGVKTDGVDSRPFEISA